MTQLYETLFSVMHGNNTNNNDNKQNGGDCASSRYATYIIEGVIRLHLPTFVVVNLICQSIYYWGVSKQMGRVKYNWTMSQ